MSKTYKAVFTCEATGERVVWYVSSRRMAEQMVYHHTHSRSGTMNKEYRGVQYKLQVKPIFRNTGDAGYDASIMGWGGN